MDLARFLQGNWIYFSLALSWVFILSGSFWKMWKSYRRAEKKQYPVAERKKASQVLQLSFPEKAFSDPTKDEKGWKSFKKWFKETSLKIQLLKPTFKIWCEYFADKIFLIETKHLRQVLVLVLEYISYFVPHGIRMMESNKVVKKCILWESHQQRIREEKWETIG